MVDWYRQSGHCSFAIVEPQVLKYIKNVLQLIFCYLCKHGIMQSNQYLKVCFVIMDVPFGFNYSTDFT